MPASPVANSQTFKVTTPLRPRNHADAPVRRAARARVRRDDPARTREALVGQPRQTATRCRSATSICGPAAPGGGSVTGPPASTRSAACITRSRARSVSSTRRSSSPHFDGGSLVTQVLTEEGGKTRLTVTAEYASLAVAGLRPRDRHGARRGDQLRQAGGSGRVPHGPGSGEDLAIAPGLRDHPRVSAPQTAPRLTAMLLMPRGFDELRGALSHLRAQTIRSQIQIVIVARRDREPEIDRRQLDGFAAFDIVPLDDMPTVASGFAVGVRYATADVVGPRSRTTCSSSPTGRPGFARRSAKGCAAVAPLMLNANPATATSWMNFVVCFTEAVTTVEAREVEYGPGHNTAYRRSVLAQYVRANSRG